MKPAQALAIALAFLASAPAAALAQNSSNDRAEAAKQQQRIDRARERCKLNHGVDCDTPEGLKEWVLQERSRQEAIHDGSRRRVPTQPGSVSSKP